MDRKDMSFVDKYCITCQNVIVKPHQTKYGNSLCSSCIKNMVNKATSHCPEDLEDCDFEEINKYPNEFDAREIGLENACPYQQFGCTDTFTDLSSHLEGDIIVHSQLVIETINHWRNEISKFIELEQKRNIEEIVLRKEMVNNANTIINLKEEIKELQKEIESLVSNIHKINLTTHVQKYANKEIKIKELGELSSNYSKTLQEIEKHSNEINGLKIETFNVNMEIEKINNAMIGMKLAHDLVWTIDNFSKRKCQYYESTEFYKDNYKACMRAWIDGYHLHLYLRLVEGERDDFVEWPMKHTVVLNVLNQDTLRVHASTRYSFDMNAMDCGGFERPYFRRNDHIGGMKVTRGDITHVRGILCSDSVVVSCSLIRPSY